MSVYLLQANGGNVLSAASVAGLATGAAAIAQGSAPAGSVRQLEGLAIHGPDCPPADHAAELVTPTCWWCGREFRPTSSHERLCSPDCWRAYYGQD